jgi:hypothetical protein
MTAKEPSGVDSSWYLEKFLRPTIKTIFLYPIIKSASGDLIEIYKLIIPEVTKKYITENDVRKIVLDEDRLYSLWKIFNIFHDKDLDN